MNVWTQFLRLPVAAFVYGLEFMVQTLRAVQQTVQQVAIPNPNTVPLPLAGGGLSRATPIGGVLGGDATTFLKEAREMSDCCCSEQCGKPFCEIRVYDYYIISVKPCEEKVLTRLESDVVTSEMSGEAFASYAIARFCLKNPNFPERDARYLRVCYRISCTFPKERKDCCTNDQVEVLREIRDAIGGALRGQASASPAAA